MLTTTRKNDYLKKSCHCQMDKKETNSDHGIEKRKEKEYLSQTQNF